MQLFHWTNPRAAQGIQRVGEIRPSLATRLTYEPVVWLTENRDPLTFVAEGKREEDLDTWVRFGVDIPDAHHYEWWRQRQSREARRLLATVDDQRHHEWWVTLRPIHASDWFEIYTVTFVGDPPRNGDTTAAKTKTGARTTPRRSEEVADEPRNRPTAA